MDVASGKPAASDLDQQEQLLMGEMRKELAGDADHVTSGVGVQDSLIAELAKRGYPSPTT